MSWGSSGYGSSFYGGIGPSALLEVVSAQALSPTSVRVVFNQTIATTLVTTTPTNYVIPGISVHSVVIESTTTVRLTVTPMAYTSYVVEVSNVEGSAGTALDTTKDTATFAGFPASPQFFATPQSRIKVQLLFSHDMLNNAALTNPENYEITDFEGNPIAVDDVTPNGVSTIRRVTLHLGDELRPTFPYALKVNGDVKTISGLSLNPATTRFSWTEYPLTRGVAIQAFTGEVQGGLYGTPLGLVFFSPSLSPTGVANSTLQVDEVSVCTKAYDTYTFPVHKDPKPLYTWDPNGPGGTLSTGGIVLWDDAYALAEFHHSIADKRSDTMAAGTDGKCVGTLTETWDPTKVSLLNSTYWQTFNSPMDPGTVAFKTADNSGPIAAGATTVITIVP